jgi:hypothetical protein
MFLDITHRPVLSKTPFGDMDYIIWAQVSRYYLRTEREFSLRNAVFLNTNRTVF